MVTTTNCQMCYLKTPCYCYKLKTFTAALVLYYCKNINIGHILHLSLLTLITDKVQNFILFCFYPVCLIYSVNFNECVTLDMDLFLIWLINHSARGKKNNMYITVSSHPKDLTITVSEITSFHKCSTYNITYS